MVTPYDSTKGTPIGLPKHAGDIKSHVRQVRAIVEARGLAWSTDAERLAQLHYLDGSLTIVESAKVVGDGLANDTVAGRFAREPSFTSS